MPWGFIVAVAVAAVVIALAASGGAEADKFGVDDQT